MHELILVPCCGELLARSVIGKEVSFLLRQHVRPQSATDTLIVSGSELGLISSYIRPNRLCNHSTGSL